MVELEDVHTRGIDVQVTDLIGLVPSEDVAGTDFIWHPLMPEPGFKYRPSISAGFEYRQGIVLTVEPNPPNPLAASRLEIALCSRDKPVEAYVALHSIALQAGTNLYDRPHRRARQMVDQLRGRDNEVTVFASILGRASFGELGFSANIELSKFPFYGIFPLNSRGVARLFPLD